MKLKILQCDCFVESLLESNGDDVAVVVDFVDQFSVEVWQHPFELKKIINNKFKNSVKTISLKMF